MVSDKPVISPAMSEPNIPGASGDSETVRLPGCATGAEGSAADGLQRGSASGSWGRWNYPEPGELAAQLPGNEVERLLGTGGMAAVYKARQLALDRPVAIKLLSQELSADAEFSERFLREARAMAKLDHPNIVRVLEFGKTSQGLLYFTMEYVDGGDVSKLLKQGGPLSATRAAILMHDVCAALECAHRAGIVHRDIKPANVLLTADGRAKVADFGLASVANAEPGSTLTILGTVMGTPDYMSPEYRQNGTASPASDVYAAGVMLYQILTGKLPVGAWAPPSSACHRAADDALRQLDGIVNKAVQEDPARRYTDGGGMRNALAPLLPASLPSRPPLRKVSLIAAAVIIAACGWFLTRMPWWKFIRGRVTAVAINVAAPADTAAVERVVLLDITQLRQVTSESSGERKFTPRDKLLALIRGLAAERPQAIGMDIDFSPVAGEPYTPDDPAFFQALLKVREETGVPVFAGVWRQDSAGRDRWLGSADYATLATGLGIDIDESSVVTGIPADLTAQRDGQPLMSLSMALARAGGVAVPDATPLPSLMARLSVTVPPGLTVREYIPNFACLDALVWQRAAGTSPDDIPGLRSRLRGNLILLSDTELKTGEAVDDDRFFLPARREIPVSGAFVHACGLVTLLSGAPAFLTPAGRILAAAILLGLLAGGFRFATVSGGKGLRARALVIVAAAIAAYAFMRLFRVAWTDVFYLSAALVLLRPLAALLDAAAGKITVNKPNAGGVP